MVKQGDDVVVRCPFRIKHEGRDGRRPLVSLTWRLDGRLLTSSRLPANLAIVAAGDAREIRLSHVQPEDAGYYTCTVANEAGKATFTSFLDVLVPPYFEEPEEEKMLVVEGGTVTLQCFPRGIPEPTLSWSLTENKLPADSAFLKVEKASAADAGHYTCQASNDAGIAEKDFNLVVLVPPRFNSTDTDLTAIDGEEMTLPCPSFGVPEPRSVWYRDGRRRVYPGPTVHLGGDGALTLTPARLHDAGSFTCVAISEAGTAQLNVTLTVYVPPSIREEPDPVVALRGRPARLSCEATGIPAPTVLWFKADPRGRKVLVGIGSFLDFPDGVTSEHQGCYVCVAENEAGSQERSVVLDVIVPPTLNNAGPAELKVMTVAGHNSSLLCLAEGSPLPQVTWLRNGRPVLLGNDSEGLAASSLDVRSNERVFTSSSSGDNSIASTLNIVHVEAADGGGYVCLAANKGGIAHVEYHVDVIEPPRLAGGEGAVLEKVVLAQHPFSLSCEADGVPLPAFAWLHEGTPLPRDSLTSVRGSWLHVSAAQSHHAGRYLCEASNVGGAVQLAYDVAVWEKPRILGTSGYPVRLSAIQGAPITMECLVTGTPAPLVTWSKDGRPLEPYHASESMTLDETRAEDAGVYACTANNQVGEASREMVLTVLVPPKIRSSSGNGSVDVTAGKAALLECVADGFPRPRISWTGPPAFANAATSLTDEHGTMRLPAVGKEHAGNYTCKATNEAGSDSIDLILSVITPPMIGKETDTVVVPAGHPAMLWCNNTGDPVPRITWRKEGRRLGEDDQAFEVLAGALYIYSANVTDSGRYVCTVQNPAGSTQAVRNLEVLAVAD
ncbi:hemicentin-1-like [Haemaphysalis longicornis]